MIDAFASRARWRSLCGITAIAFLAVAARLIYLHILNGEALQAVAEKNRYTFRTLYARRGDIQDSKGNLLATTRAVITLGIDPQVLREEDKKKFPKLAELAGIPLAELEKAAALQVKPNALEVKSPALQIKSAALEVNPPTLEVNPAALHIKSAASQVKSVDLQAKPIDLQVKPVDKTKRPIRWKKLAEGLSDARYEAILALKIKGVYGNRSFERLYPAGRQGAHVLGFMNKEGLAVGGVEQYLDFYLRGQDGWVETECDGKRQELVQYRERQVLPRDGSRVELYLDLTLQHIVEKKIEAIADTYKPLSISIIVSEASGPILALANYPGYDPNHFSQYSLDAHRNLAITDVYEPGSAFKIVVSSAALEEKVASLEETFDCGKPTLFYKGRELKLPKNYRTMGVLSMGDVVVCSSNRGMVHLAIRLGEDRFYEYIKKFGFGELTGYDGLGEVRGIVHKVKDWDGLTITRLPMGHALAATPLQMHCAMGVIAYQGLRMKPLLIKRISDDGHGTLVTWEPTIKERVISEQTATTLMQLLEKVARNTKIRGVPIGYKTGTTQKLIQGRYSTTQHVSSSSGFIRAKDKTIVLTLVIDSPQVKGTAYGALVASPYFKELAEEIIHHLKLEPPDAA